FVQISAASGQLDRLPSTAGSDQQRSAQRPDRPARQLTLVAGAHAGTAGGLPVQPLRLFRALSALAVSALPAVEQRRADRRYPARAMTVSLRSAAAAGQA